MKTYRLFLALAAATVALAACGGGDDDDDDVSTLASTKCLTYVVNDTTEWNLARNPYAVRALGYGDQPGATVTLNGQTTLRLTGEGPVTVRAHVYDNLAATQYDVPVLSATLVPGVPYAETVHLPEYAWEPAGESKYSVLFLYTTNGAAEVTAGNVRLSMLVCSKA